MLIITKLKTRKVQISCPKTVHPKPVQAFVHFT